MARVDPDWQHRHRAKVSTAGTAVLSIAPGRRLLIGSGAAEPATLVEALVTHGAHLADNEVVHLLTLGEAPYVRSGMESRFRHTAFFIGPNVREAVHAGRADYMPIFLSEIPALIRSGRVHVDVALVQVTPPDVHGYVSLGVSVDVVRAAVDTAPRILAEVNPHMPRTLGDSFLHVDRIAHLVPVDRPLPELESPAPDDVAREIGRNVASLVPDGATLQAGIGSIPNAVLAALDSHHDLGLHSEMLSDGVMALAIAGNLNGRRKSLLRGKHVTSFVMGSRALYAWCDEHPAIELRPSEFTNDPATIARNDRMIAINSALAIDLTGQVASDTLLGRFFSGIGGQVDFIRGAARSRDGRAIIALPATADDGRESRIRATLEEGAGVVTSRGDVHHVVTEYGIADLWGRNIRQRALQLIEIAHPDFRGELLEAAKARRYVFADQIVPRGGRTEGTARSARLRGGETVVVRPLRVTDEQALQELLYRLSDESIYRRFLSFKRRHPHQEVQYLVDLDYRESMALAVTSASPGGAAELVGVARYDLEPATRLADIAFVVRDDWQGKGVGTLLMQGLTEHARGSGIAGFTADVLVGNERMLRIFRRSGLEIESRLEHGSYHLAMRFDG